MNSDGFARRPPAVREPRTLKEPVAPDAEHHDDGIEAENPRVAYGREDEAAIAWSKKHPQYDFKKS